jgi:hypothetical protein
MIVCSDILPSFAGGNWWFVALHYFLTGANSSLLELLFSVGRLVFFNRTFFVDVGADG